MSGFGGFGGFGSTNNQQQNTGFGGFGATNNTNTGGMYPSRIDFLHTRHAVAISAPLWTMSPPGLSKERL
jgi:hypothetical protein